MGSSQEPEDEAAVANPAAPPAASLSPSPPPSLSPSPSAAGAQATGAQAGSGSRRAGAGNAAARLAYATATAKSVEEGEAPPHALERLFRPRSLAVIGGSDDPAMIGGALLDNLLRAGFAGPVVVVNPDQPRVRELPTVARIADLETPPDLALITTGPETWSQAISDLGQINAPAAMIVSAGAPTRDCCGSEETVDRHSATCRALADQAAELGIRLVGPGSIGLAHPSSRLDATFARALPPAGTLALVTRSGASLAALLDLAAGSGIGVSLAIASGDGDDIDFGDILDFLTFDPATRGIALMVESIKDSRFFVSALRAAARAKPVVVLHPGSHLLHEEERAAFDAVIARCGAVRVASFGELFSAVESLSTGRMPRGERLGVVTNGPGLALLAADACATHRVAMVTCADGSRLRDLGEAATASQFAEATAALIAERANDAVLAMFSPTRIAGSAEIARALIPMAKQAPALHCCVIGGQDAVIGRDLLNEAGLVVFDTPGAAVRGFAVLAEYQRNQRQLLEAPRQETQTRPLDEATIDRLLEVAAASGQTVLDESATYRLLEACGIPLSNALYTGSIDEAATWARSHGYPIRLAALPPEDDNGMPLKDDEGRPVKGEERINIRSERELRGAAAALRGRWLERWPGGTFLGFRVRRMLDGRDTLALRVTIEPDPTFGPVLRFGAGGRAALLAPGLVTALPPLTRRLAEDLVAASPVANILDRFQDLTTASDSLIDTLLAISDLAVRYPAITSLRIDPIYADLRGLTAGGAKITIDPANPQSDIRHGHLTIHPYPVELEKRVTLKNNREVFIRPIKPDDAARISAFFDTLSDQTRHWRFLHPIKVLTAQMIARFTQVDYERDLALVGLTKADPDDPASEEMIVGVTRYVREADAGRAEFAIVVTDDWQGTGLASALMSEMVTHARRIGLRRLVGLVHRQNLRMLSFMRHQGFRIERSVSEPSLQMSILDLNP